ncbi:MAG: lycopene beta-cyclase CrtY [Myxococcales bacterium]|nr:lycopene beta-cyclase CrtY [Myxococcales bacterium]
MTDFDLILVGGGLQSSLMALAVLDRRPGLRLALVERDERLGGNHTWCFHGPDVAAEDAAWLEPLVVRRWPSCEVAFPGRRRMLGLPYVAVTSDRLDEVVGRRVRESTGSVVMTGTAAVGVGAERVELAGGHVLRAPAVIDARGPLPAATDGCGFQKFLGLELRLSRPRGDLRPLVMDATVPQRDGFRFLYLLPFAPDRVLLEDTYFSNGPELDRPALRAGILAEAEARGLAVERVVREEEGVLPMPWRQAATAAGEAFTGGYRGGWFHPATGYSFPAAVRLARRLAEILPRAPQASDWDSLRDEHERQAAFGRLLNRLLFTWVEPGERWRVFERFYGLPEETIARFYAMRTSWVDRGRILLGSRPPGLLPGRLLERWRAG